MLRSKATAALMKLKEIDRKYKTRSNEDFKLETADSSLSDISTIDNKLHEVSEHDVSSGNELAEAIINTRPKLDIRMPDAHMERAIPLQKKESEPVTIFDKPIMEQSSKSESNVSSRIVTRDRNAEEIIPGPLETGEENFSEMLQVASFENRSVVAISEEQLVDTGTSISEDVPEVVSSSHPVANHFEPDVSQEITLKSIDSIIDAEERVQSDLDEDSSTLVTSETYSDDFVKTFSSGNAKESRTRSPRRNVLETETEVTEQGLTPSRVSHVTENTLPLHYQRNEFDKNTESEDEDNDANLDAGRKNLANKIDLDLVVEKAENPVSLLQQKSSRSSSARSSNEYRRSRRPRASSLIEVSKSGEFSSSPKEEKDLGTCTTTSGTLNPSKQSNLQSGKNSLQTSLSEKGKDSEKLETLSFQEMQKYSENKAFAVIRREKVALEMKKSKNAKSGIRAKDTSTKEPPPLKFLKFSKDDQVDYGPENRIPKNASIPRGKNRRSNKPKIEDSPRSKHRSEDQRSLRPCKKAINEELGFGYEARDFDRLKQEIIKELRLQQERDQLRTRVRGYVQQMMNERQRLMAHDPGFTGSINEVDRSTNGLQQTENLRSFFFKPLDLPNVAGFKRPDFQDCKAADLDNERYSNLQMIRERLLGIRYWLKQQFALYKDYSSLAATINANYIPVDLKETKKMIHDFKRFYNYNSPTAKCDVT